MPTSKYPVVPSSISSQEIYYWFPVEIKSLVNIPYVITNVVIEDCSNDNQRISPKVYIYNYGNHNILPGSGYATIDEGFALYNDILVKPGQSELVASNAAIFILIPADTALMKPVYKISMDYQLFGILGRSTSLTLK